MTGLRDMTAGLESAVNSILGDEITYTPDGGDPLTFDVWVEFDNEELRASGSSSTARVRVIEVLKSIVPVPSKEGDRVTIALLPGLIFKPANIEDGAGGATWRITLMRAPGV